MTIHIPHHQELNQRWYRARAFAEARPIEPWTCCRVVGFDKDLDALIVDLPDKYGDVDVMFAKDFKITTTNVGRVTNNWPVLAKLTPGTSGSVAQVGCIPSGANLARNSWGFQIFWRGNEQQDYALVAPDDYRPICSFRGGGTGLTSGDNIPLQSETNQAHPTSHLFAVDSLNDVIEFVCPGYYHVGFTCTVYLTHTSLTSRPYAKLQVYAGTQPIAVTAYRNNYYQVSRDAYGSCTAGAWAAEPLAAGGVVPIIEPNTQVSVKITHDATGTADVAYFRLYTYFTAPYEY